MIVEPVSISMLISIGEVIGGIATSIGFLFGVFKVINWVKTKFTNIDANVLTLNETINTNFTALRDDIKDQTKVLNSSLSEQRQDFRTFFTPLLMGLQTQSSVLNAAPARARRNTRKAK